MKKLLTLLFFFLMITACAETQPKVEFTDNIFLSNFPELKVKIHKEVLDQQYYKRTKSERWVYFSKNEATAIDIIRQGPMESTVDYRYSAEQYLRNIERIPLETVVINNRSWTKYVYFGEKNIIFTGYFIIKDDDYIFVARGFFASRFKDDIEDFKRTHNMTDRQQKLLNEAFEYTDRLFTIEN
jgi:hypothetical protein